MAQLTAPARLSAHQGLFPVAAESLEVLQDLQRSIICHTVAIHFQDALACTEPRGYRL